MTFNFKGSIQCYQSEASYEVLLEIDPEEYFGEPPLKWETGWDSADIGDMTPEQYYSWAEFVFKNDVSEKLYKLPEVFPDNEWDIEVAN